MAEHRRLLELAISGLRKELQELEVELKAAGKGIMKGLAVAGQAEWGIPLRPRRRRRMSAASRARIAAAQKARWAKKKATAVGKKAAKKTRKVSSAARKAASARMKAYWAKRKAS